MQAVNDKRGRLHQFYLPPVLPYVPTPTPSLPLTIPPPSASAASSPIHIIGYLPTDDDIDESHCISWSDVWSLRAALLSLSASSSSPPPRHLFFLHGAPITAEEEPMVTFLTAAHLEQHYSGSYHDVLYPEGIPLSTVAEWAEGCGGVWAVLSCGSAAVV